MQMLVVHQIDKVDKIIKNQYLCKCKKIKSSHSHYCRGKKSKMKSNFSLILIHKNEALHLHLLVPINKTKISIRMS